MKAALVVLLESRSFDLPGRCDNMCPFASGLELRRRTAAGVPQPEGLTWCRLLKTTATVDSPTCTYDDWREQAREEAGLT